MDYTKGSIPGFGPLLNLGNFNALPDDAFFHLLSFLNIPELLSKVTVSEPWHVRTVKVIRSREYNVIVDFCKSLADHLDPKKYGDPIAKLLAIGSDKQILSCANFLQIKRSILKIKMDLVNILIPLIEAIYDY